MNGEVAGAGPGSGAPSVLRLGVALVELWVVVVMAILGLAFIMGLLGANPDASFASWIYARSSELMTPFNGIFDPIDLTGNTVVQTSLLFAIVVYGLIGAILGGIAKRLNAF